MPAPTPKLTQELAGQIRERAAAGEDHEVLAADYGVHKATISRVVRGLMWVGTPYRVPASADTVRRAREMIMAGERHAHVAEVLGVSVSFVSHVVHRRRRRDV